MLGPITHACNNARPAYNILSFLILLNYIQEMLTETTGSIMLGVVQQLDREKNFAVESLQLKYLVRHR